MRYLSLACLLILAIRVNSQSLDEPPSTLLTQLSTEGTIVADVVVDGSPLPGVTIEAVSPSGRRLTAVTGADGRVTLRAPELGLYRVRASLQGFSAIERTVDVRLGTTARVQIAMSGGPVPVGGYEGISVISSSGPTSSEPNPCTATEKAFSDDVALQKWLDKQAASKCVLTGLVHKGRGKSIFLFRKTVATYEHLVLAISQAPTAANVQARADGQPSRSLRGAHVAADKLTLLVFTDD